eukprot:scaffold216347_cov33-Tisochrysis_lutea.AAC.1
MNFLHPKAWLNDGQQDHSRLIWQAAGYMAKAHTFTPGRGSFLLVFITYIGVFFSKSTLCSSNQEMRPVPFSCFSAHSMYMFSHVQMQGHSHARALRYEVQKKRKSVLDDMCELISQRFVDRNTNRVQVQGSLLYCLSTVLHFCTACSAAVHTASCSLMDCFSTALLCGVPLCTSVCCSTVLGSVMRAVRHSVLLQSCAPVYCASSCAPAYCASVCFCAPQCYAPILCCAQCGIVYCFSRSDCEKVARELQAAFNQQGGVRVSIRCGSPGAQFLFLSSDLSTTAA